MAVFLIFGCFSSLILLIPSATSFQRSHGELCDWRSHHETCDETRGLACSYKTHRCNCWDVRTIYSMEKGRCVGKSSEPCHTFGGERLCTEHAYCLEDESLSPIPICLCLKGYFKGSNGSCIRRSKYGEFCDHSSKYPASPSAPGSSSSPGSGHSTNSNCEPESGLHCVNYKCQCEPKQIYDGKRELCISLAGMQCSKSLENCVQNAHCSEKIWSFDHATGETKMIGHRCACRDGLKVTEDGFCAVEYGGKCATSSECYFGEGLSCINEKCQCHPLSQVYDRRRRQCLNLVGTKCQDQSQTSLSQLHQYHSAKQQEELPDKARMDFIIKPQQQQQLPSSSNVSSSPSPLTKTTAYPTTSVATTSTPFHIKPRNASSRNFYFIETNNKNGGVLYTASRQLQTPHTSFPSPRHYRKNFNDASDNLPVEHRTLPTSSGAAAGQVMQQCVDHAECMPSSSLESESVCMCKNGTSETIMGTCMLDHGQPCGHQSTSQSGPSTSLDAVSLECNVFDGLACHSDTGTCQCADPMLIYDSETRSCLSTVGSPCGRMRLNPNLLSSYFPDIEKGTERKNNQQDASSSPSPFYQNHSAEQFVNIKCVANATCEDKSVNGQFKQVCLERSRFSQNGKSKFAL